MPIVTSEEVYGPYTRARVCSECSLAQSMTDVTICPRCGSEDLALRVGRWKFKITTRRLFYWTAGFTQQAVINFVAGREPWKKEDE